MKNKMMKRIAASMIAMLLCGSMALQPVFADDTLTGNEPAAEESLIQEEQEALSEAAEAAAPDETASLPAVPEAPSAPAAPEAPQIEGLDAKEANALISEYNAAVDAYNADAEDYNAKAAACEDAVRTYNENAAAYNAAAEEENAAAGIHNREVAEKESAYNEKMAAYESKMATYNKNVAAIQKISDRNTAAIGTQVSTLGDIGRVTKDNLTDLGHFLEEDYYISYGFRSRKAASAGDLIVYWDELMPTADHNTIDVVRGTESGTSYKAANLHIFQDFTGYYDLQNYYDENGYDCFNIVVDDAKECFIIPKTLLDRLLVLEYEVVSADKNDEITLKNQSSLFASGRDIMAARFFEGYTDGVSWVSSVVTESNAMMMDSDWTGMAHTISFQDGTVDRSSIKNPLNVNYYHYFQRYSNPLPVKPEEFIPDYKTLKDPLELVSYTAQYVGLLSRMDLLEIPEETEETEDTDHDANDPETGSTNVPAGGNNDQTGGRGESGSPKNETPVSGNAPRATVVTSQAGDPAPNAAEDAEVPAASEMKEDAPVSTQAVIENTSVPASAPKAAQAKEEAGLAAIEDGAAPMAAPAAAKHWALLNLICAILAVLAAAAALLASLRRNKEQDEEEEQDNAGRNRVSKLFSLIPAAASVILFILTEDMRTAMQLTDVWTIPMIIILLAGILLAVSGRKNKEEETENEQNAAVIAA